MSVLLLEGEVGQEKRGDQQVGEGAGAELLLLGAGVAKEGAPHSDAAQPLVDKSVQLLELAWRLLELLEFCSNDTRWVRC